MKHIITHLLIFTALFMALPAGTQIPYCLTGVEVELSSIGTAEITPEDIDAGSIDAASMTVSPNTFNCSDVGPVDVTLTVTDANGNSDSCITTVYILDNIAPVAICDQQVNIELGPEGTWVVDISVIDEGSYDFCTSVNLHTIPYTIECNGQGEAPVTLVATDSYGNTSSCVTMVSYEIPDPTIPLACNDEQVVYLPNEYPMEITADMLLEGSYIPCEELYDVTLSINGVDLSSNYVDGDNVGDTILTTITQLSSGNMCWGFIIIDQLDCDPFYVCDTLCHTAPVGDCDSGHTLDDNVEWPCDLLLSVVTDYPSPDYIIATDLIDTVDVFPTISTEPCHLVDVAYADVVFLLGDEGYRIEREWTVVEWISNQNWQYVQIVEIGVAPLQICDTVAWSEPESNCGGSTGSDDIEWPANDTIFDLGIAPVQLASNQDVHPNNVQPIVLNTMVPTDLSYTDEVERLSDEHAVIYRSWTLKNLIDRSNYEYEQELHVFDDLTTAEVCVTSQYGLPVADVQFDPAVSNADGCAIIDVNPGLVIEPSKDDITADGIDLVDAVLLQEYILGMTELTPLQLIAADINMNQVVSTLDLALLHRLLDGTPYPGPSWRFFDNTENSDDVVNDPVFESITVGQIPEAYRFLGVKLGDLDFSIGQELQGAGAPIADMHIMDEVLNSNEEYNSFIFSKDMIAVQGLSMDIDLTSQKISILDVTSDVLPGFSSDEHVEIKQDKMFIRYTAPDDAMQSGEILVMPDEEILKFHITATGNGILSDEFKLVEDVPQFMKLRSSSEHVRVRLNWDDEIVSRTKAPRLEGIEIFPSPAKDFVSVTVDHSTELQYSVTDMSGRYVKGGDLVGNNIDVSSLNSGLYLLQVTDRDGKQSIHKLIIQH